MSNYRLVWFQHFHKAAGTTIVELAKQNAETFYTPNINGNPINTVGKQEEIWKYSPCRLMEFVDHCEENKFTFVATEWGVPHLDCLKDDRRVTLITCLRDPYSRFVSNYLFDYRMGFTDAKTVREYIGTKGLFSEHNYYCRMLGGIGSNKITHDHKAVAKAKEALHKFDHVSLVEDQAWLRNLCFTLNWNAREIYANKQKPWSLAIREAARGNKSKVARLIRKKSKLIDTEFYKYFLSKNKADMDLYHSAIREI